MPTRNGHAKVFLGALLGLCVALVAVGVVTLSTDSATANELGLWQRMTEQLEDADTLWWTGGIGFEEPRRYNTDWISSHDGWLTFHAALDRRSGELTIQAGRHRYAFPRGTVTSKDTGEHDLIGPPLVFGNGINRLLLNGFDGCVVEASDAPGPDYSDPPGSGWFKAACSEFKESWGETLYVQVVETVERRTVPLVLLLTSPEGLTRISFDYIHWDQPIPEGLPAFDTLPPRRP